MLNNVFTYKPKDNKPTVTSLLENEDIEENFSVTSVSNSLNVQL